MFFMSEHMIVGIIGAPNKGKSTLFSAMTVASAEIADYPFTTIKPNHGIAYAARQCVERELHIKCKPRNSMCVDGTRLIPIDIVDVAGLVPGAHLGKGMGNQFLNDICGASVLIQVVDASGKSDANGNRAEGADAYDEVKMVKEELSLWLADIISRHMPKLSKEEDGAKALREVLSGFKVSEYDIKKAASAATLTLSKMKWSTAETQKFSSELLRISKPMIIAANKIDKATDEDIKRLAVSLKGCDVILCSGMVELALRKTSKEGKINYVPGERNFEVLEDISAEQAGAFEYIRRFLAKRSTGVNELINEAAFSREGNIVVYPVEDENKFTDHFGNTLPDAVVMKGGSTAMDLAAKIHSELAVNMIYAVDAKKKIRVAKDYVLRDNDVIKIVSAAK